MPNQRMTEPTETQRLSKLLFEAREQIDMWADVVASRTNTRPGYLRTLVERIDAYRAEQGWSPHGFGGEESPVHPLARPTDGNSH